MIIDTNLDYKISQVFYKLLETDENAGVPYSIERIITSDYEETRKHIEEIIRNKDKLVEIAREVAPKTLEKRLVNTIERLVDHLSKTLDVLENPPEWLRQASLLEVAGVSIGKTIPYYNILERYFDSIVESIPLIFEDKELFEGKRRVHAIVSPTKKNLEMLSEHDKREVLMRTTIGDLVTGVAKKYMKVKDGYVELFGYKITLNDDRLVRLLDYMERTNDKVKLLLRHTDSIRKSLMKHNVRSWKISASSTSVYVVFKISSIGDLKNSIDQDGDVTISLYIVPYSMKVGDITYQVKTAMGTFTGRIDGQVHLDQAGDKVSKILEDVKRNLKRVLYAIRLDSLLKEYGFDVMDYSLLPKYINLSGERRLRRHILERVLLEDDLNTSSPNISLTIRINPKIYGIKHYDIEREIRGLGLEDFETRELKEIEVHVKLNPSDPTNVIKEISRIEKLVIQALDNLKKKRSGKVRNLQEISVLIYWYNNRVRSPIIDFDDILNRPERVMYSMVTKLVKTHLPSLYDKLTSEGWKVSESPTRVIKGLIESGYIRLEGDKLYIGGERAKNLFESIGYLPQIAERFETNLIRDYVSIIGINGVLNLARKGKLTGKVEDAVIDFLPHDLNILLRKLDEKRRFIDVLTPKGVSKFIKRLWDSDLIYIIENKEYLELFKPYMDVVVKTILSKGGLNITTLYYYKFNPNGIDLRGNPTLYREKDFIAIKVGDFLVQVMGGDGSIESVKTFVLYHKDKKIGLPVRARTILEAFSKGVKEYDRHVTFVEKVKQVIEGLAVPTVISKDEYYELSFADNYYIPVVHDPVVEDNTGLREKYGYVPLTIEVFKKIKSSKKTEEEVSLNAI